MTAWIMSQVPSLGWLQIAGFAGIIELNVGATQLRSEASLKRLQSFELVH